MTYQYIAESTLPEDTQTYVTREADSQLYQALLEGKLCYVFNSRKIGKSSLALQTIKRLRAEGIVSVFIDLSGDETKLEHPEQWYANILDTWAYELDLDVNLKSWLDERNWLSPLRRLREFIESVMLSQVSEKIVIFFDEIDSVLSLNFSADDLFAFIRSCYNRRTQNADYNRITFCLLGVATPSDLIQDKKRTPFNIGQAIELKGFTHEQAAPLAKGLEGKIDRPIQVLNKIIDWTGGQPFLTQKLCKIVLEQAETSNPDIAKLVQAYIINNWEENDNPEHLGTIRDRILSNQQLTSQLLGIYQQIITPPNPPLLRGGKDSTNSSLIRDEKDSSNPPLAEEEKDNLTPPLSKAGQGGVAADNSPDQMELQLSGLVVKKHGQLQVYNPIYRAIFNLDWVQQELAKLRPYQENFAAWIASNRQDISRLLRGKALDDALQWKVGKRLSDQDNDFLDASQADERQELRTSNQFFKQIRREVRKIIKIEEAGRMALNLFQSDGKQIEALRAAIKAGEDLKKWIPDNPQVSEYPVTNPLLVLQMILAKIRERRQFFGHNDLVRSVSFSPTGDAIATASDDKTAKLWDLQGNCLVTFTGHNYLVNSVSFSPTGDAIATASYDGTAKLWDLQGNCLVTFTGHHQCSVSFSPTGDAIATASIDGTAKLWDLQGNCLATFTGHNNSVISVSFSPTGKAIATASSDKTTKLWDLQGNCLVTFTRDNDSVRSVSFSPTGDAIATASSDKTAKLWDLLGNSLVTFTGHKGGINSVIFSPTGDAIATASDDKTANLWHLQGKRLVTFTGHNDWVTSVSFSPTGDAIATASNDDTGKLWDLQGNCLVTFTGHNHWVISVSFSPTGDRLATASNDGTAKLWDLQGNCLVTFTGHNDWVTSVSFSPQGDAIATASSDNTVKLWDLQGNCLVTFTGHNGSVNSVSFSPTGDAIATASDDCTAKLWGLHGNCLVTFTGHNDSVWSVSFRPTGDTIATASQDGTAKLWDLQGSLLADFSGYKGNLLKGEADFVELKSPIWSVCFSRDGKSLITGSLDGKVRFWPIESLDELLARGREWLGENF
ncbi:WD40 domain-containing protein [Microcoleus sp. Pol12B4]|uniref:WD40 domain-containing protein n=1 Tax=Microcoleus sp. Pol12B4 TaxID=3055395 RepID=UPI002FCFBDFB